MAKPKVALLHGIRSQGEWYPDVRRALEPHFDIHELRYTAYETWGILKVVGDVIDPRRRKRVMDQLAREFLDLSDSGTVPHLVAHSLGTWLTGMILIRFGAVCVGRVVFCGSPLSRKFPWDGLRRRVEAVHNEVSPVDMAARVGSLFGAPLGKMGAAGSKGFLGSPDLVHNLADPYASCDSCMPNTSPALVHNVWVAEMKHSDYFFGPGHAERFWLPFLWRIDAAEYFEFLTMCTAVTETAAQNLWANVADAAQLLGTRIWSWYGARSLAGLFDSSISGWVDAADRRQRVARGLWLLTVAVDEAKRARQTLKNGGASSGAVRALHPVVALQTALGKWYDVPSDPAGA